MSTNVVAFVQPPRIEEMTASEIDCVDGGARISNAAAGVAAGIWAVWTGAFTIGYSIGKDIGEAIFNEN